MQIYGFAFQLHNVSTRTLYQLDNIEHNTLLWGVSTIDNYVKKLLSVQPDYVLGMGIYTGKNRDYLHLETETSNQFKRTLVDNSVVTTLQINPFLFESESLVKSKTLGNSLCNYVCWKIVKEITDGKLKSQFSFVHIPNRFDPKIAAGVIMNSFNANL